VLGRASERSGSLSEVRAETPNGHRELPLVRREASIVSPLRYPGGKRRLAGFVAEAIRLNSLQPCLFVEPFAGGASVALQLVKDRLVERIALGEKDPLVASFWKVVFQDSEWLVERVQNVKVDLATWDQFKQGSFTSTRDQALACLFLNRTSFSGILAATAGPIGGRQASSKYSIDCRFPVDTLVRRIREAAALADRVEFVANCDWRETLRRIAKRGMKRDEVFYYFDPPFYQKAHRLYSHFFSDRQHRALRDKVLSMPSPWLLSYDPCAPIIHLYSQNGCSPRRLELLYSTAPRATQAKAEELIVSNLAALPSATRLWRSAKEWQVGCQPVARGGRA